MGIPAHLVRRPSPDPAVPPQEPGACTCGVCGAADAETLEAEASPANLGSALTLAAAAAQGAQPQAAPEAPPALRPGTVRLPGLGKGSPDLRRQVPIAAYVGPNGSGKSLCMVRDTVASLAEGRPVLSTVRLLDVDDLRDCDNDACRAPEHGTLGHKAAHPLYVPLTDFRQLMDAEHCDVLLDEVTGVADARESGGMPVQVRNLLVQLRRRDVVLRWTSPSFTFADVTIRRVTQAVTFCRGMFPVEQPGSLWRDRRLFLWRTFDARDIPHDEQRVDASLSLREEGVRPLVREVFWRPGSLAESAYSTSSAVNTLGVANQAGMCMTCGGKRTHPRCSCD